MATMITTLRLLLISFFIAISITTYDNNNTAEAALTDPHEVAALQAISNKLQLTKWNFSVDPCSGEYGWNDTVQPYINCSCTNSTCHVTKVDLYNLNLAGHIPVEFANLTHLTYMRMGLNCLSGEIPRELGRLGALSNLDLGINQLTGPLPVEIANITSLTSLGFGSNNLSGVLPREIGQLSLLTGLYMDGSGISGEIPLEFGKLQNLTNVWMMGTPLSGPIPDVFYNMTMLSELRLYGNNLTGPIPPSILMLSELSILSIGDLLDGGLIPTSFKALKKLKYLSLRHNHLSGQIPEDLGFLNELEYLDLSFNNLAGRIPPSLSSLSKLKTLFLGNNSLEGSLPNELGGIPYLMSLDVSYNQLSGSIPAWVNRSSLQKDLLWNSFDQSDEGKRLTSATFNCLNAKVPCSHTSAGNNVGFAINCGGSSVQTTSPPQTVFSGDTATVGNASFLVSTDGTWGVSQVGYQYDGDFSPIFSTSATIQGTFDEALYKTARGSASSLKYYGLDMVNGAYDVELHFAEIALQADNTWKSLGQRIFDVYIQGSRVLKDFNIRAAANGSYIRVVKIFSTEVTNNVLEIHLLWSGKGTCCSPTHWTYGPLISAIRVQAGFNVPKLVNKASSKPRTIVILGPILAGILIFAVLAYLIWKKQRKFSFSALSRQDFSSLDDKLHIFTYSELKAATEDFHVKNKLGQGGFGAVFKGCLPDGTMVAVKQLTSETEKGTTEFMNEVATISALQHRNLVKLIGCCVQEKKKILVFEYLDNNSLSQALLENNLLLNWKTRFNICIGIARGLMYLHEESRTRIVHRDIKASNILLDQTFNPKIADFGLAKLFKDDKTHISTRVAGTVGYLAPEYALRGKLTEKADIFSFGILLLEIVSGRSNTDVKLPNEQVHLIEWTWQMYEENRLLELADSRLDGNFSEEEVLRVIHVALLCTQALAVSRPKMSEVLSMLTGSSEIVVNISRPGYLSDLRQISDASAEVNAAASSTTVTTTPTWTTSSSSTTTGTAANSVAEQSISEVEPR